MVVIGHLLDDTVDGDLWQDAGPHVDVGGIGTSEIAGNPSRRRRSRVTRRNLVRILDNVFGGDLLRLCVRNRRQPLFCLSVIN